MTQQALFFTAADVQLAFDNADDDLCDTVYELYEGPGYVKPFEVPGLGTFESVQGWREGEEYGGALGWVVKHVESGRMFFREGQWASYDGDTWDTKVVEVEVVPIQVNKYKSINSGKVFSRDAI